MKNQRHGRKGQNRGHSRKSLPRARVEGKYGIGLNLSILSKPLNRARVTGGLDLRRRISRDAQC